MLDKLTLGPPRPSLQVLLPIPMSDPPAGQYCRFRSLLPQGVSEGQGRAWEAAVAEQCGGGRVLGFHLRVRSTVSLCRRPRQRQERLPPPAPAARLQLSGNVVITARKFSASLFLCLPSTPPLLRSHLTRRRHGSWEESGCGKQ